MGLENRVEQSNNTIAIVAIILACIAIVLPFVMREQKSTDDIIAQSVETAMERIQRTGILRVGYGGFPPYTMVNLSSDGRELEPKGFSVDLVNAMAEKHQPPLKIEWHRLSWDSLKADLESKRFDFVADPVYQTITRAAGFRMSLPYSYIGIGAAVVRVDDDRFSTFADLDGEMVTISLAEGWTTSEFARKYLTKPKFKSVPVSGDAYNQLDEVLFGRVDVALNDVPTVAQYVKAHSSKVKALWLEKPPSLVPGGFTCRQEDSDLAAFLDTAVRILIADGTLEAIDKKWGSFGSLPTIPTVGGYGLRK